MAKSEHAASRRVRDRMRTEFTFQISVDVGTLPQGIAVAEAARAGGVDLLEMGTPLLKCEGVLNVVPAFRARFQEAFDIALDKAPLHTTTEGEEK